MSGRFSNKGVLFYTTDCVTVECFKFVSQWFFLFPDGRIPDAFGRDIEKACQSIYPLHDVFIRKVKVLKKPKFDSKLSNYYFTCLLYFIIRFWNRMAFCMRMRCWCGGNVQGVCPSFILALPISVFFAIFHMEAPENTQEFFSIAFL